METHLGVGGRVDTVVVDAALVAQRDGPLSRAALALAHQKAAVDAAAQQVLGGVAGHGPVVPAVLLQAVDGRDVVAGNPALAVLGLVPRTTRHCDCIPEPSASLLITA